VPDSTLNLISTIWEWLKYAGVTVLGLFGWYVRTQSKKISDLERESVSRSELTSAVNGLTKEIHRGFDHLTNRIDNLNDKEPKC